jgi:hypothetical protein
MSEVFPRPFAPSGVVDQDMSIERPFLVAAMSTPDYADRANRLAASCRKVGVPYVIYEVPSVHRSISPRGVADERYTKSSFIRFLLDEHRRPILYVDADCVFVSYPDLIERIAAGQSDFAIYNWLADEHTDCFVPVKMHMPSGDVDRTRFYRFSHAIDHYAPDQLICSGAVQFYRDTAPARALLEAWHETIQRSPGAADDPCLDFAFNNFGREIGATPSWLPKAYARYAWWIYEEPVINHPEFPNSGGFADLTETDEQRRFYPERTVVRQDARLFPRDCIIDTAAGVILAPDKDGLRPIARTQRKFWL